MKRVLCGLVLGAAAFAAAPANAAGYGVKVTPSTEGRVGVGVEYTRDGKNYDPVGGAYWNPSTGEVCAGMSYQIPVCVGGPIE